jgi:hypothetical protein
MGTGSGSVSRACFASSKCASKSSRACGGNEPTCALLNCRGRREKRWEAAKHTAQYRPTLHVINTHSYAKPLLEEHRALGGACLHES